MITWIQILINEYRFKIDIILSLVKVVCDPARIEGDVQRAKEKCQKQENTPRSRAAGSRLTQQKHKEQAARETFRRRKKKRKRHFRVRVRKEEKGLKGRR